MSSISKSLNLSKKGYVVCERVGVGGFGEVYKIQDVNTNKYYAAKILKGEVSRSEMKAYENEAIVLKKLMHPNIIEFHDST